MNNLLPHQAKLYEQALMYIYARSGEHVYTAVLEHVYGGLRTRTAIFCEVRSSLANKSKSHRDAHASEGWLQLVGLYIY